MNDVTIVLLSPNWKMFEYSSQGRKGEIKAKDNL